MLTEYEAHIGRLKINEYKNNNTFKKLTILKSVFYYLIRKIMSIRTKLLSWRNINTDSDFSKYIETVSEPWVIEWFAVSTNSVAIWKARVPCERTNWETIYSLVENFSAITIDTSWTWYVIISIPQNMIDDWSIINEDWTNVASVSVVQTLPTKNYLQLASLSSWTITDSRNMIKKVWELNTAINSLFSQVNDLNERVEDLEKAGDIACLKNKWLVWELYALSDDMFLQNAPKLSESTVAICNVWDSNDNKEIHIQRISNWEWFNKLKLKIKMEWSPTTNVKVEVRKWIQVTVTENSEAYWYWDDSQILAYWSLAYSTFSSSWYEAEFTLNNSVEEDEWALLDIVVYQENSWEKIVNASNYYILACDSTQYSEAFSFVSVNWTTRVRSCYMPYCSSIWFTNSLFSKIARAIQVASFNTETWTTNSNFEVREMYSYTCAIPWKYFWSISAYVRNWVYDNNVYYQVNDWDRVNIDIKSDKKFTVDLEAWDVLHIWTYNWGRYENCVCFQSSYVNYIWFTTTPKKNKLFEIKSIGSKISWYLFWLLPNWEWWDWE
jgi:hypothetical protein